MTTADRIRNRRIELGLTQLEVAKRMGATTKAAVSKIENQGDKVSLKNITKMSEILDCSIAYLMGWQENIDNYENELEKLSENMRNDKLMRLVDYYSQLSSTDQDLIENMIKSLASKKEWNPVHHPKVV